MVPLSGKKIYDDDRQIPLDLYVPLTRREIMLKKDPVLDSAIVYHDRSGNHSDDPLP